MLDKYKNIYDEFLDYINQVIVKEKKISHAYLFVVDDLPETKQLIIDFAKVLICPNEMNKCNDCNICNLVDNNFYDDLMIIEPDGSMIKKEQLINLQSNFINTSFNNNRRVYIIFDADKLNESSGNSILKFLEEPADNITAILVSSNSINLLKTIVSRCLTINIKKNIVQEIDFNSEKYIHIKQLLNMIEDLHEETIAFLNELEIDFSDRESLRNSISIMLDFYQKALKYKILDESTNDECLKKILINNDINSITNKVNVLCDMKEKIKYNVNMNLLMDKLIIDLSSCKLV